LFKVLPIYLPRNPKWPPVVVVILLRKEKKQTSTTTIDDNTTSSWCQVPTCSERGNFFPRYLSWV